MSSQINKSIKYIILVLLFSTNLFACALCRIDVPMVFVDVNITQMPNKTHFVIKWNFHKTFIKTLSMYDENDNRVYDKNEKANIQEALEVYISKYNYLAQILYTKQHEDPDKSLEIVPISTKLLLTNNTMYYQFVFDTDFKLTQNHILRIMFGDTQGNFDFRIKHLNLNNYKGKYKQEILLYKAQIIFGNYIAKSEEEFKTEKQITVSKNIKDSFIDKLSNQLTMYKNKIKNILNDIKQNNTTSSYVWLLLFSFLYGILHAVGPGHGKTLIGSYFLSSNRSVIKAFNMSMLIGVVHTFSAFLLTVFIYFILHFVFNSFITNTEYVATKLSAIFIILIAIYLIYKKFKTKSMSFSEHNPNVSTCGCNACDTKSEDVGVILASGIVPCPGSVTIFIFTFGLGLYYVGFLSAIFMSLGMSLIIFLTAYASINIRKKSQKNTKLLKFFEYGSLLFILMLGIFLLFV